MTYSSGGYSWLGVAPEPRGGSFPLENEEIERIEQDCEAMELSVASLDAKIEEYHALCKQYEAHAGTPKGEGLYHQLQSLKHEIAVITKSLNKSLYDSLPPS